MVRQRLGVRKQGRRDFAVRFSPSLGRIPRVTHKEDSSSHVEALVMM